jgi:hypothetical protein
LYDLDNDVFGLPIKLGDMIILPGHIMMVSEVNYIETGDVLKLNEIVIIESASGNNREYRVLKTQTMKEYIEAGFRFSKTLPSSLYTYFTVIRLTKK